MPIYDLTVTKTKTGVIFVCPKCKVPGFDARGVTENGALSYLLICSRCAATLGEWPSIEESEKELTEFAEKLLSQ